MGTGLLSAVNRTGSITPLVLYAHRLKTRIIPNNSATRNVAAEPALDYDQTGSLRSVSHLTQAQKATLANRRNYQARAEIALDVASAYPGGDYFEFGAVGLATFRSFLAAFDLYEGHTRNSPSTRFYAFDIFGNPDQGSGPPPAEHNYFEAFRSSSQAALPLEAIEEYRLRVRAWLFSRHFE